MYSQVLLFSRVIVGLTSPEARGDGNVCDFFISPWELHSRANAFYKASKLMWVLVILLSSSGINIPEGI